MDIKCALGIVRVEEKEKKSRIFIFQTGNSINMPRDEISDRSMLRML